MEEKPVRHWDVGTKRLVGTVLFVLLALIVYRFRTVLPPLILAFLLAFILDPVVDFLERRVRIPRTGATALVFLVLIAAVATAPVIAMPPIVRAVNSLNLDFVHIAAQLDQFFAQPIHVLQWQIDLRTIYREFQQGIRQFLTAVATGTVNFVVGFVSTLFWVIFILLSAFYLTRDADRIVAWLDHLAPDSLRSDWVRLRHEITKVWNAFLRGQILLGLFIAVITTGVNTAIGLPNAPALGLLAGVLEFIPNIGPTVAAIPAILIAFFQGSYWLPLSNFWFAVLVAGVYVLIQQVEANLLIPRIMGRGLNLHPVVVLIAVILGGSLAGVLGVLIAAPTVATLRVLAQYLYRRLTDQEPFPVVPERPLPRPWLGRRLWDRIRRRTLARRWVVRPARPEDQPDIEAICAQIGGGEDYIPRVWDQWLADPVGELSVVELDGRVVALAKLSHIADEEWWLEGMRVHPNYRRLGVSRLLQAHQLTVAEQQRAGVVRFATASYNRPIHRNALRDGFRRVAEVWCYRAEAIPTPSALHPLSAEDLEEAWRLVETSPIWQASRGLYEQAWRWQQLTRSRLAAHIAAGEVWGIDLNQRLAALAIVFADPDEETLSVGYLDGIPEGLKAMAWGLRLLAFQQGYSKVRVFAVADPVLLEALRSAGLASHQEYSLYIFEKPMKGDPNGRNRSSGGNG
ncbi:MAG: AI-2E family transporter [Anaerolineae bacterium]|nr:AI-2E family transporter [Anaerolineae bacterium]